MDSYSRDLFQSWYTDVNDDITTWLDTHADTAACGCKVFSPSPEFYDQG